MPRCQDPFAVSALEHACLTQRKHHLATLWISPDIADVVEFHREPGYLAAGPYLQRNDRDLEPRHCPELLQHLPLELGPAHILSPSDGIAHDVCIMGHEPSQSGNILVAFACTRARNVASGPVISAAS